MAVKKKHQRERDNLVGAMLLFGERMGSVERALKQIGKVAEMRERNAEQAVTIRRLLEEKEQFGLTIRRLSGGDTCAHEFEHSRSFIRCCLRCDKTEIILGPLFGERAENRKHQPSQ